ncbi:hypothetical protein [Oceanobacter kriegii]|uniref:hypothetical protein n=1 Tax=Oceanobacter kriegii TaxID=64972 RepID=UPI0004097342|nr:hypothetical protein [Oceanobacter kriegii]
MASQPMAAKPHHFRWSCRFASKALLPPNFVAIFRLLYGSCISLEPLHERRNKAGEYRRRRGFKKLFARFNPAGCEISEPAKQSDGRLWTRNTEAAAGNIAPLFRANIDAPASEINQAAQLLAISLYQIMEDRLSDTGKNPVCMARPRHNADPTENQPPSGVLVPECTYAAGPVASS